MLIYPQDEARATSLRVANIGRTIEICTLDISAEPSEILASVERIAARVRAMTNACGPRKDDPGTTLVHEPNISDLRHPAI